MIINNHTLSYHSHSYSHTFTTIHILCTIINNYISCAIINNYISCTIINIYLPITFQTKWHKFKSPIVFNNYKNYRNMISQIILHLSWSDNYDLWIIPHICPILHEIFFSIVFNYLLLFVISIVVISFEMFSC